MHLKPSLFIFLPTQNLQKLKQILRSDDQILFSSSIYFPVQGTLSKMLLCNFPEFAVLTGTCHGSHWPHVATEELKHDYPK